MIPGGQYTPLSPRRDPRIMSGKLIALVPGMPMIGYTAPRLTRHDEHILRMVEQDRKVRHVRT